MGVQKGSLAGCEFVGPFKKCSLNLLARPSLVHALFLLHITLQRKKPWLAPLHTDGLLRGPDLGVTLRFLERLRLVLLGNVEHECRNWCVENCLCSGPNSYWPLKDYW